MSFEVQERVLLDLLFDSSIREQFRNNIDATLTKYDLDENEINDFKTIRPDALELDANMRTNLFIAHICRSFPVTFSLVSSFNKGIELLKKLVNAELMHTPPTERTTVYGTRLREQLVTLKFDNQNEQPLITAILEAELGMAWTAATLKQVVLENGLPDNMQQNDKSNWSGRPIKLASYVSAAMLPQPYTKLKQKLCPNTKCDLWTEISKKQLNAYKRNIVLQQEDPRLLIARAQVNHVSQCEPGIDHQTIELSEGFAHLFQHVNGSASIDQLLTAFKQAGAPDPLLQSVKAGFKQLIDNDMLFLN